MSDLTVMGLVAKRCANCAGVEHRAALCDVCWHNDVVVGALRNMLLRTAEIIGPNAVEATQRWLDHEFSA